MKNTTRKKSLSLLLSALMAFGVLSTGVLPFMARAEDRTAVVHIRPGEGIETLTVYNVDTGQAVADGDSVAYGSHLRVGNGVGDVVKHDAYQWPTNELGNTYIPVYINGVYTADLHPVDTEEVLITTADLEKNVYQLRFDPNGGELVGSETTRPVRWNEDLPEAIRAVRPGYTFKGYMLTYYLAYDENYNPLIRHPLTDDGGTAEAKWQPAEYSVTVDPNGGSLDGFEVQYAFDGSGAVYPDSVTAPFTVFYNIESEKRVPYIMAPAGYTFTGWAVTGEEHGWPETAAQSASLTGQWGNVTLTAQLEPKTNTRYYVRYYVMNDDGTYPASPTSSVTRYGTTDTLATAETNPPEGFSVDMERSVLTGNISGMGNRILKVYYKFDAYTVTFLDADGNVLQESAWRYGATPAAPAALPEKAYDDSFHYTAGWDREIVPATQDAVYTLVYTPEAHDFAGYTPIAPATCSANAQEEGTCACGKTDVREVKGSLAPDAHSYVNYVYNGDATFTEDGTETARCEYDASHTPLTRTAPHTAFRGRYSDGVEDVIAGAQEILRDAQENEGTYAPEYVQALSGALDALLTTDPYGLTDAQTAAIEQKLTDLVGDADSHMNYDRTIQFHTIGRMHYVIEEGDGFSVYTSSAVRWFSAKDLHFHVYTYTNFPYDTYQVYINGEKATPDENGVYTLPAGSTADTVSIVGATEQYVKGTCPYCGQEHDGTLWGRLVALIHQIVAFLLRLFGK